jgi:hypothetical protein
MVVEEAKKATPHVMLTPHVSAAFQLLRVNVENCNV